jgi:hypothetical protein
MGSKIRQVGTLLISAALLLLITYLYLDGYPSAQVAGVARLLLQLLRELGLAVLILGLFNFILAGSDWQAFFEERLRRIVVEQEHLKQLKPQELRQLMHAAINAQAPEAHVDRSGGFLEYFEDHLHQLIFTPYRENAMAEMLYSEDQADPSVFHVLDKYSYVSRTFGSDAQTEVRFTLDPDECVGGGYVTVTLQLPMQGSQGGRTISLERLALMGSDEEGYMVSVPLEEKHSRLDGLGITVAAEYKTRRERVQTWWMLHPTRDLRVVLSFPPTYRVQMKDFVQVSELATWTRRPGYLMFRYSSWLLPGNGVAWGFFPAPESGSDAGVPPVPG